jgi:L-malate glycosyltransferase
MLQRDGAYEVVLATLNKEGVLLDGFSDQERAGIHEFKLTSFFNFHFVSQLRRLASLLRESKIDLIHSHDFYTNVFGAAAANLARVKCIASKRETFGMRTGAQNLVERIAFHRADAVIVNSAAVREYLIARGVRPSKLTVVYNGLDSDAFDVPGRASPAAFGLPAREGERFVTLVANLRHDVKNVTMLLRAAREVTAQIRDVHFVIAGEGELADSLKQQAAELKLADRAHFIGRCNDVSGLLSMSAACVLTSKAEGFSNSILEYMAAGKPVVATDVGGAREAIADGETGYIVASDDDQAMAERLLAILNDQSLASRLGEAGRSRAREKFSLQTQLKSTLDLYGQVLRG